MAVFKSNDERVMFLNDSTLLFPEITTDNRSLEELIESVIAKGYRIDKFSREILDNEKEALVATDSKKIRLAVVRGHPYSDCVSPPTANAFAYNAKLSRPSLRDTLYLCELLSSINLERFKVRLLFVMHEPVLLPRVTGKEHLLWIGFGDGEKVLAAFYYNEGDIYYQNTGYAFFLP